MSILIIVIHVIVCIALILVVLLQTGKGADMGAAFGGGSSQTVFGSTGASSFLSKMTTGAAIVFMLTSLTLAYVSSRRPRSSIMPASTTAPMTQDTQVPPPWVPMQSEGPEGATDQAPTVPADQSSSEAAAPQPASTPAPETPDKG